MLSNIMQLEKTLIIEKKLSESRNNFQNREKKFGIQKNTSESKKKKKKMKSRKIFQNRETFCRIEKYFVTRIEKKS